MPTVAGRKGELSAGYGVEGTVASFGIGNNVLSGKKANNATTSSPVLHRACPNKLIKAIHARKAGTLVRDIACSHWSIFFLASLTILSVAQGTCTDWSEISMTITA